MKETKLAKRHKKMMLAAVGTAALLAGGISISSAWSVPGVDRPFDPANYYSLTSISWADSAPSPFALRELSQGTVYDYTREIKSILFGDSFKKQLDILLEKLAIDMKNREKMPEDIRNQKNIFVSESRERNDDIFRIDAWRKFEESTTYKTMIDGTVLPDLTAEEMIRERAILGDTYAAFAKSAEIAKSQDEEAARLMETLLERLATTESATELEEIKAAIDALTAQEEAKKNALFSQYTKLQTVREMEKAKVAAYKQELVKDNRITIRDPYDTEAVEADGYKRERNKGFKRFE